MRVSPPELALEFPGPQASTSVTCAPRRNRCSALQPPNAPAPTTTTCTFLAAITDGLTRERAAAAFSNALLEISLAFACPAHCSFTVESAIGKVSYSGESDFFTRSQPHARKSVKQLCTLLP